VPLVQRGQNKDVSATLQGKTPAIPWRGARHPYFSKHDRLSRCQNRGMQRSRLALFALLVIEGLGGLIFAALTVIIGESITPGFIPWGFALIPALFGVAVLGVAFLVWHRREVGLYLAAITQSIIGVAAVVGLFQSGSPELWIALAMSLIGIALVAATTRAQAPA
jgi:hypothetical protein